VQRFKVSEFQGFKVKTHELDPSRRSLSRFTLKL
jgi:hypothetical protein